MFKVNQKGSKTPLENIVGLSSAFVKSLGFYVKESHQQPTIGMFPTLAKVKPSGNNSLNFLGSCLLRKARPMPLETIQRCAILKSKMVQCAELMKDRASQAEQNLLRIGDVAKQTGITLRTLRYYEELQLIEPINRTKGNFRLYSPNVIQRVQFINSLKKLDFTLEEIREILGTASSYKTDRDVVERTRQALLVKKEKIAAKLIELADMNREVDISLRILEDCLICKQEHNNAPCDPLCEHKTTHIQ